MEQKTIQDICDIHLEKGFFTKSDVEKIQDRIKNRTKDEIAQGEMFVRKLIRESVEDGIDQRIKLLHDTVKIKKNFIKYTTDPITGEQLTDIKKIINNRYTQLVGRNSVDSKARNLRGHLIGSMDRAEAMFGTPANSTFKSLRDIEPGSQEERELFRRVYKMENKQDLLKKTPEELAAMAKGTDDIGRIALSLAYHNEYKRNVLNRHGVSVKFASQYVTKRRYDWGKVSQMTSDEFADFMSARTNIEKTFGRKMPQEEAKKAWKDIYRELEKTAGERTSVLLNGEFASAKANSISRKVYYLNEDAEYDAFDKLTMGGLRDQIEKDATSTANTATAVKELGYDSRTVSEQVTKQIYEKHGAPKSISAGLTEAKIKHAELELSGRQNYINSGLTTFSNTFRTMNAITMLGGSLKTALLDPIENQRQVFYTSGDMFGGYVDYVKAMKEVFSRKKISVAGMTVKTGSEEELKRLAADLGVVYSYFSNGEGMRMASGDYVSSGSKFSDAVTRYGGKLMSIATLIPPVTGMSKVASAITGAKNFTEIMDLAAAGNSNSFIKDTLKQYNLSDAEVNVLSKMAERTDGWTAQILTGNSIRTSLLNKNPKQLAGLLGVSEEEVGDAVLALAEKAEVFINDFTVRGTPAPELSTKILLGKTNPDETIRVLSGLLTQFKDTPIAQMQNVIELGSKMVRLAEAGDKSVLGKAMAIAPSIAIPMAAYTTMGISTYLMADTAVSLATQSESLMDKYMKGDSTDRKRIVLKALDHIAVAPFLFEAIAYQFNGRYNETALNTFTGSPALSVVNETLGLLKSPNEDKFMKYLERRLPFNAIPARALKNWGNRALGNNENLFGSGL